MVTPYFNTNTIYCGDCKEVLAKFPNECAGALTRLIMEQKKLEGIEFMTMEDVDDFLTKYVTSLEKKQEESMA